MANRDLDALRDAIAARAAGGWALYEGAERVSGAGRDALELLDGAVLRGGERLWRVVSWEERGGELRLRVRGAFGREGRVLRIARDGEGPLAWGRDWFDEAVARALDVRPVPRATVVAVPPAARARDVDTLLAGGLVARDRFERASGRPATLTVYSAWPALATLAERVVWLAPRAAVRLVDVATGTEVRPHDQGDLTGAARGALRLRAGAPCGPRRGSPERWLAALVRRDVTVVDPPLDPATVYEQVPAISRSSRERVDMLAVTRAGRLAVVELKAREDRALPLQGLDYWNRVRWAHARGEIARRGYFPGTRLDPRPPLLYLVAPLFYFHASVRVVVDLLRPEVEAVAVGLNTDWRRGPRAIARFTRT